MKKKAWLYLLIPVILLAVLAADLCFRNDLIAHSMTANLSSALGACEGVEVVETASVCGKLSGNGNGMHFFGVCLVKCQDTNALAELKASLQERYETVDYSRQKDALVDMDYNEHQPITLDPGYNWEEPYYIFYYCETDHPLSNPLDLRGH